MTMTEHTLSTFERQATGSTTDSESYDLKRRPEGGTEAWLTVLGSFLVYYASYGLVNSFGYFHSYHKTTFLSSTTSSTIAFIGTLQVFLMNTLASISGALCDSYGVKVIYIFPDPSLTSSNHV